MKKHLILWNPEGGDGGGAGAGSGAAGAGAGQGAGQGAGAGSGSSGGASSASTAKRLWGDIVETGGAKKPDSQGAGTSGGAAASAGGGASDGETGTGGGAGAADGRAAASGTPPNPNGGDGKMIQLTEEMLGTMGQKIAESIKGAGAPAQEKQVTQEEFDKMFNIYRPTEQLLAYLRSDDPKVVIAAYQELAHGAARQAVTIASHLIANQIAEIRGQFQPAMDMAQERAMEQAKTEFFEKNPDLKGLDPLLVLIRDQMVAKGVKFKTKEEAFKAVADEARKQMEALPGLRTGANGGAGGAGAAGQGAGNPPSRMPTLSGGKGSGGAGDGAAASGGAGNKPNTAKRIFG